MGQGDCQHHIQFSVSFLATPETPLPSPPQGSGQEPYKIAANQASVISHQSLSKQKQLWEYVYFWMALHKCEKFVGLKISQDSTFGRLLAKASSWCCYKDGILFSCLYIHFVCCCYCLKPLDATNVSLSFNAFV